MAVKFSFETLDTPIEADWPVQVQVPTDGGKVEVQEFMVRFRELTDADFAAIEAEPNVSHGDLRRSVLAIEGKPVEPAVFEKMLAKGYVRLAMTTAYARFINGVAVKN